MADFIADLRDLKFVLFDQLDLAPLLKSERFSDFSPEDFEMMIDEAHRLAKEVFAPSNEPGDREGCKLEDGKVTVPAAYHEPYQKMIEGGWLSISNSAEYGGGGTPDLMRKAVDDLFFGANISLNLGVLLTIGTGHLIEAFGTDELKQRYVEKMYSGQWAGTMCLTEAGAGSDVGAVKTKAKKVDGQDHYLIDGEKIFITFGDHDLTETVIHAVLARVAGAPAGTKGLSLFIVPKHRINDDGTIGERNNVDCPGIEHKMGINGSPTCTLTFGVDGDCHGWLLGEEGQGMRAMFQMMNEARISVGMQGAALGNAAYQQALAFARERLQGSHITQIKNPDAPRVPIVMHPDVRMMLMKQKAYGEGLRSMMLYCAWALDYAEIAEDEEERQKYHALVEIMTPICKAYGTDIGFRMTEWAMQTFGGYGYIKEYPAEQFMRDAKIASIYEGTNGIQAMDLVGRKLSAGGGANVKALYGLISKAVARNKEHPVFADQYAALSAAKDSWAGVNQFFVESAGKGNFIVPLLTATNYLSLCGDMLMAYFLLDQAVIAFGKLGAICQDAGVDPADPKALKKLGKDNAEAGYYYNKVLTARYFCAHELPQVAAKAVMIKSGDTSAWEAVWTEE